MGLGEEGLGWVKLPSFFNFVSSIKKTEGFRSLRTFLKVKSLDLSPAAFTPKNLKYFVTFRNLFLFLLFFGFFVLNFRFFLN